MKMLGEKEGAKEQLHTKLKATATGEPVFAATSAAYSSAQLSFTL